VSAYQTSVNNNNDNNSSWNALELSQHDETFLVTRIRRWSSDGRTEEGGADVTE